MDVYLKISAEDVNTLYNIYDAITKPDFDYNLYVAFEEIVRKAAVSYDETVKKVMEQEAVAKRLADMKEWADERCTCGHTAHIHTNAGKGLCVSDGGGCPCFQFVPKAKPKT